MSPAQIEGAVKIFSSLSEPARLCLLKALMGGPRTVGELVGETGMKQGNVSKHLGLLVDAGLLGRQRDGNFVRYSVRDPLVYELCELVCDKIRRDAMDRIAG